MTARRRSGSCATSDLSSSSPRLWARSCGSKVSGQVAHFELQRFDTSKYASTGLGSAIGKPFGPGIGDSTSIGFSSATSAGPLSRWDGAWPAGRDHIVRFGGSWWQFESECSEGHARVRRGARIPALELVPEAEQIGAVVHVEPWPEHGGAQPGPGAASERLSKHS